MCRVVVTFILRYPLVRPTPGAFGTARHDYCHEVDFGLSVKGNFPFFFFFGLERKRDAEE